MPVDHKDESPRLCGCGCGVALTASQRVYASRACTVRGCFDRPDVKAKRVACLKAAWTNPAVQAKRIDALRKAKAKERLAFWWEQAHVDQALEGIQSKLSLDDQEVDVLRVMLARLMRRQYQRGYRMGNQTAQRRARRPA